MNTGASPKPAAGPSDGPLLPRGNAGRMLRGAATAAGLAATALFAWCGGKTTLYGINSDGAVYVLLADWFSPYRAAGIDFATHLLARYPFPPLFPLVLAAAGGGTAAPLANYFIGAVLLGIAVAMTVVWAGRSGGGVGTALASATLLATLPATLFIAMGVFSEPLYLALTLAAAAVLADREPNRRAWYAAGLLLACAALARSAGAVAILAFVVFWAVHTRAKRFHGAVAIAVVPPLTWAVLKHALGFSTGYVEKLLREGVSGAVTNTLAQIPINLEAIAYHGVRSFDLAGAAHSRAACVVLALAAAVCWWRRLRSGHFDALYVLFYAGVLLIWPFPNHSRRFLLMILPFVIVYAAWTCAGLAERCPRPVLARLTRALPFALAALVILPSTFTVVSRIAHYAGGADAWKPRIEFFYEHADDAAALAAIDFGARLLDSYADIADAVPAGGCITAVMPEFVQLYARRRALAPPAPAAGSEPLDAALRRCPYIVMVRATPVPVLDYVFYYPLAEIRGDAEILRAVPLDPAADGGAVLTLLARYRSGERAAGRGAADPSPYGGR